ncbi:hypothetical protein DICVIV_07127 [Dictyocaulus viviparus]|uniref:Uncharacterized protein n=1 Tax=Dictyocaulus viviparus TaxID=29172 RepID=A0A0D8XWS8_DICVI|nr:hypothetical protein DICVIV_07127 [Dictyocaulus viviparus]
MSLQVWNIITCPKKRFGRCCKLAVRIICRLLGKDECTSRFNEIFADIEGRVSMENPDVCVNALQVISEFHRSLPQQFGTRVRTLITEFVVPGLILSPDSDDDTNESHDLSTPLEERSVSQYCLPKVSWLSFLTMMQLR